MHFPLTFRWPIQHGKSHRLSMSKEKFYFIFMIFNPFHAGLFSWERFTTAKPFSPLKIRKIGKGKRNREKSCVIRGNVALYGAKSKNYSAARPPFTPPQKKEPKLPHPPPRSSTCPLRITPSPDAGGSCVTAPSRLWQCQDNQIRRLLAVIGSARTTK